MSDKETDARSIAAERRMADRELDLAALRQQVADLTRERDKLLLQLDTIANLPTTVGEYVDDEIAERREFTDEMATKFGEAFGTSPQLWKGLYASSALPPRA